MNKPISALARTRAIMDQMNIHTKKKFGQNFLIDDNILNQIVAKALVDESTDVIEIGPGIGSLTLALAKKARRVLAYEIDTTLKPVLDDIELSHPHVKVIYQDILKSDVNADIKAFLPGSSKTIVVANLPYYITTPILLKLLEEVKDISSYSVMMQKEVADRICARSNIKDYNSLSIVIQYRASAKKIMTIPKNVFIPKPNVDSAVVKLDRHTVSPYPKVENESLFFELVRASFVQRRKTLINNLLAHFGEDRAYWETLFASLTPAISIDIRAEALALETIIDLSNKLNQRQNT